ncbi:MAG: PAS domain S-box protein, partial [Nitrospirales bacterium]
SEYVISIIRKDGGVRHLQVFRKEILWDGKRQFQVLYQDITECKRVEDALRESEERYRTLIETSRDLIYTADRKGSITYMNPALEKILGYTPHELNGKSFAEIFAPDFIDKARDLFRRAMKGELIPVYEAEMIRKDGGRNTLEFNVETLYDKKGKPAGRYGIGRDITDRRRVEEELRTSQRQLRDLAERQQRAREEERIMIAREIHDELGGGLVGLKMDLSWLLNKLYDTETDREITALLSKVRTSSKLIDKLILVVRRVATDLRPSILDDLGLIAALEWQLQEFADRTEIQHEFVTALDYVNLEKNTSTAVFRIFQEALTNVLRHSRATKVVVTLREGDKSLFGDENIIFEIRDNGKGITEEEILNPESLGLLGMKERVLAFGGELSIRGEPGGGTVLILKIPRIQGEPL